MTGRALGLPDEAEQLVDDVEGQFAAAVAANPDFAGTVLPLGYVFEGAHYVLEEEDLRTTFFTDLGFAPPDQTGEVSPELLTTFDRDVLVVVGEVRDALLADPLFAGLDVVREDRTVYLGDFTEDFAGALGFSSPLSLPYALDVAVPLLAQAADGDPATAVEDYAA